MEFWEQCKQRKKGAYRVNGTNCNHPFTVEIYNHVFRCSSCGTITDEATEEQKEKRREDARLAKQARERREAKIRFYKGQYRK